MHIQIGQQHKPQVNDRVRAREFNIHKRTITQVTRDREGRLVHITMTLQEVSDLYGYFEQRMREYPEAFEEVR